MLFCWVKRSKSDTNFDVYAIFWSLLFLIDLILRLISLHNNSIFWKIKLLWFLSVSLFQSWWNRRMSSNCQSRLTWRLFQSHCRLVWYHLSRSGIHYSSFVQNISWNLNFKLPTDVINICVISLIHVKLFCKWLSDRCLFP